MIRIPILLKIPEIPFDYIDIRNDGMKKDRAILENLESITYELNKALYLDPYRTDFSVLNNKDYSHLYLDIQHYIESFIQNRQDLSKFAHVITTLTSIGISNVQHKLEDWLEQRNPQDIKELLNPKYCTDNE